MKDQTTWQDILEGVGKIEMTLRRAHIDLQDRQNKELTGEICTQFVLDRNGSRFVEASASPGLESIQDVVVEAILDAPFPTCRQATRVNITCHFDLRMAATNDPFDDPFAADYGTPQTRGSSFGDPF